MRIVLRVEDVAEILREHAIETYHTLDVVVQTNDVGGFVTIVNENEAERLLKEQANE